MSTKRTLTESEREQRRAQQRERLKRCAEQLLTSDGWAELAFTAEGSDEDTGWFRWSIDAQAFEAEPDAPLRWLGDPWPVEVAGVDIDELVAIDRREGRQVVLAAAADVVQRTRATALAAARAELLGSLAGDLAKGVGPFEPGGMAGPAGRE
jgi:hypothetical protein